MVNAVLSRGKFPFSAVIGVLLITALFAGTVACGPDPDRDLPAPSDDLEIRDWHDLNAVRDSMDGDHRLMNDLDSTTPGYLELASTTANDGKGWQPIGIPDDPSHKTYDPFHGTFDGQGYEIRDLVIYRPEQNWVGLFGVIAEGSVVENMGVANAVITGDMVVGGLVGASVGSISNSYFSGDLTGTARAGGLAGFVGEQGTTSQCYSTGSLTGGEYIGGLAGGNEGTIDNCYSTTSVSGDTYVGGLIGDNYGTVSNSYSAGSVAGDTCVGGLIGDNYGTVSDSYSRGSVTGTENTGGLVGLNEGSVSNSFWDTDISGIDESDGGSGKTTVEMQDMATFTNTTTEGLDEPWNIVAVGPQEHNEDYTWNIVNGVTYPFLGWQSA